MRARLGRFRTSTLVLLAVFVGTLVVYLFVRPDYQIVTVNRTSGATSTYGQKVPAPPVTAAPRSEPTTANPPTSSRPVTTKPSATPTTTAASPSSSSSPSSSTRSTSPPQSSIPLLPPTGSSGSAGPSS